MNCTVPPYEGMSGNFIDESASEIILKITQVKMQHVESKESGSRLEFYADCFLYMILGKSKHFQMILYATEKGADASGGKTALR